MRWRSAGRYRFPLHILSWQAAKEAYTDLLSAMAEYKARGLYLQRIAEKLNAEGHTTRRGKPWNPVQVSRVLLSSGVIAGNSQGRLEFSSIGASSGSEPFRSPKERFLRRHGRREI